jgi:hypothetical protein
MYEGGVIYRDNRLVNWDCVLRTAVSDIEVGGGQDCPGPVGGRGCAVSWLGWPGYINATSPTPS